MNYYTLAPLIALATNLLILGFVAGLDRKSTVNRAFMLVAFLFAGWAGIDYFAWTTVNKEVILPALRFQSVFYISLGFALLHFAYVYIERNKDAFYYITLITILVMDITGVATGWIAMGFISQPWGISMVGGPLFHPGALLIAALQLYALYILWKHRRNIIAPIMRNQILFLVIGYLGGLVVVYTTWIVLPHLYKIYLVPFTYMGIVFFELMIFIAILKFRFFSIGITSIADELFSQSQVGVAILDHGEVIALNEKIRLMMAMASETNIESRTEEFAKHWLAQDNSETEIQESIGKGGAKIIISISGSRIHGTGLLSGLIIFVKDVTDSIRMQDELEQANSNLATARDDAVRANKAKSYFLANMSHELRTPLNAIIGYSEMVTEELEDSSQISVIPDLNRINSSGRHLLALINNILDLSKIEAGKMDLYVESFELHPFISDTAATFLPLLEKNNNKLVVNCAEDIGDMKADLTKIRQLLLNLLANATKFTKQGTVTLAVRTVDESSAVEFSVSDTGIGINKDQLQNIFQDFSQAEATTSRNYGGTGLGLIISRRFCEMMGGNITVDSQLNHGSVFTATIPIDVVVTEN